MSAPHYEEPGSVALWLGDCLDVLAAFPEASVDAVVTDPPYGLEFMGKEWDRFRVGDRSVPGFNGRAGGSHGEAGKAESSHPARRNTTAAFGGGKRPTTSRCEGCGKRDQFRKPHGCHERTNWRTELIDPHAAPPTMLAFQEWARLWAAAALRVAKPGAHLVAFGGTRTFHRLTCAIEDAGWEIRDSVADLAGQGGLLEAFVASLSDDQRECFRRLCGDGPLLWVHGQGFPKSLDVSKAIDREAGIWRGRAGAITIPEQPAKGTEYERTPKGDPITAAAAWDGWGTALKPAWEPIILARKPLDGTVAANVAKWGTGGINVDGCRIGVEPLIIRGGGGGSGTGWGQKHEINAPRIGRFPANVCFDEEAAALLDAEVGDKGGGGPAKGGAPAGVLGWSAQAHPGFGDSGGPSRFFFVSKEGVCDHARSAVPGSSRPSERGDSVPSHAPTASGLTAPPEIAGRGSIANSGPSTQRHNHAASAVRQGGIVITPTTPIFCGSCGCALRVTDEPINSGGEAEEVGGNGPASATRFRYSSKASRSEREEGLHHWPRPTGTVREDGGAQHTIGVRKRANHHPTVKPIDLMRWLCRLVTPPGGVILDPFMGSGTTGRAALMEGCQFVGIEREPEYMRIAEARIRRTPKGLPFKPEPRETIEHAPEGDGQMGLAL